MHRFQRAMLWGSFLLLWGATSAKALQEAEDRRFSPSDRGAFIVSLYREYYQRVPSQGEVNEWLGWLQRGSSYDDVHASFIGSDESAVLE